MKVIHAELASGTTSPSPDIACWIPSGNATGVGVIVFPGGGYGCLAPHEGLDYAEYLCAAGIAAFVVTYRLGSQGFRYPAMLEDALAAIGTVRSRAPEFGVHPDRIGVMGSSAGGHLAAHCMNAYGRYDAPVSLRPDFGILCYPVIASHGEFVNKGSFRNLLGEAPSQELLESVSCDLLVSADTPPCFLWHTVDDEAVPVENSLLYAQALRSHGVSFEMHLYPKGRHGLGLDTSFNWGRECLRWIGEVTQPA